MDLGEGANGAARRDVCMLDHADEVPRRTRVVAERRREGVVDDPDIGPVRRDRRCRVVTPVARRLDRDRRRPADAAIGRRREQDVLMVEAVTAIRPRVDDPVRGVGAGRGAVGDVHARVGPEVVAGAADAVLDAPPDGVLEGVAQVGRRKNGAGLGPVPAAVDGRGHELQAAAGEPAANWKANT